VLTEVRGERHVGTRESAQPPAGQPEGEYSHPTYIPTLDPGVYQDVVDSGEYLEPTAGQVEEECSHTTYIPTSDSGDYKGLEMTCR